MRRIILAGAILATSTNFAVAADVGIASSNAYRWAGPYLGANIGYGWSRSHFRDAEYNVSLPIYPPYEFGVNAGGLVGGAHAGFNWQNGRFVTGVEADLGYLGLRGSAYPPPDQFGVPYDSRGVVKGDWYAAVSARLGAAQDRTLFYVKAGGAYTGARLQFIDDCIGDFFNPPGCGPSSLDAQKRIGLGYLLGGGIEHAASERWTMKVDYSYFDFGQHRASAVVGGDPNDANFGQIRSVDAGVTAHVLRVGVSYRP